MLAEILHRIFYAFVSGITFFLPVSPESHQILYRELTGFHPDDPWLTFFVLMGGLGSLIFVYRRRLKYLLRQNRLSKPTRRRKSHPPELRSVYMLRLCRTALIPIMILFVVASLWGRNWDTIPLLCLMLALNGCVLYYPRLVASGDRNSLNMHKSDGVLMGVFGAIGAIPGFSRVGGVYSIATGRAADRSFATELALLLCVPVLVAGTALSLVGCFFAAGVGISLFLIDLLAGIITFGFGCFSISLVLFFVEKTGLSFFSFYSWGLSMISFFVYLIV